MGQVCWSDSCGYRSKSDCGVENIKRNGVAESMQEI
jgi:uncharacterized protein YegP (UPF0339 family)